MYLIDYHIFTFYILACFLIVTKIFYFIKYLYNIYSMIYDINSYMVYLLFISVSHTKSRDYLGFTLKLLPRSSYRGWHVVNDQKLLVK